MKKKKLNLLDIVKNSIIYLLIALIGTIVIGYFAGYTAIIVNGWSSEPDIPYESLIIDNKKTKFEDLKVGDFITWSRTGKSYVTHEIVAICEEGYFIKGQEYSLMIGGEELTFKYGYSREDSSVVDTSAPTNCNIITKQRDGKKFGDLDYINYEKNFVGKVVYTLPVLGKIAKYIQNNTIEVLVIASILVCMFIIFEKEQPYVRLF